jgi:hypothetical protein
MPWSIGKVKLRALREAMYLYMTERTCMCHASEEGGPMLLRAITTRIFVPANQISVRWLHIYRTYSI